MREALEGISDLSRVKVAFEVLKLQTDEADDLLFVGLLKKHDFIEASPDRRIKLPFVIGRGNDEALPLELLDQRQKAVHNAA